MDEETNNIKQEALRLSWHMRGGLTYDMALQLGQQERKLINDLIKENVEITNKSGMPHF